MTTALHEPRTLDEALALLGAYPEASKVLAGGQSLVLLLHHGLLQPHHLVSLRRVQDLQGIREEDGGLCIGAMTTQRDIETSPVVRAHCLVLQEAAAKIASVHIRHLGTLGGNLCHSLIGADFPPVLLALDARLDVAGPHGSRAIPAAELFRGFMETAVEEDEILTAVHVPDVAGIDHAVYLKHCVRAVDPAIVGVAAWVRRTADGVCQDVRVGVGGTSDLPQRAYAAETVLRGRVLDDAVCRQAGDAAQAEIDCIPDAHASADYRQKMVSVFVRRALLAAWQQGEA